MIIIWLSGNFLPEITLIIRCKKLAYIMGEVPTSENIQSSVVQSSMAGMFAVERHRVPKY